MKKLFLIVLLLPLLFAVEMEEMCVRMPMNIEETNYGYVPKGDTNWVSFDFMAVDTIIIPTYAEYFSWEGNQQVRKKLSEDTLYVPQLIIEYKGQKFKIKLEPIIEENK